MEIQTLLKLMTDQNASDLHLVVGSPPILRITGVLTPTSYASLAPESVKSLITPLLNEEQKTFFEREKELDLGYEHGDSRFRINVHYSKGAMGVAIRRIPKKIPTLTELRMPKIVESFCSEIRGLVLVTGPTGCGKSTTQASMIDLINTTRGCHIITVEDPIEYVHAHKKSIIEQREVGLDTLTFGRALKRVLRQDPDVILVGEMRDLETIQTAITAAETGHLVISTLHTPDAPGSIDRMIDVFPPHQQAQVRLQLSMVLKGIIAQQLIPRKDKKGMIAAVEVLVGIPAVKNIIRKATTQELYTTIEISLKYGMQGMDTSLKELYQGGVITYEEAITNAQNAEQLTKSIKQVV
ncbi:MAG: twitching motility protein PilT [Candidatus Saganbacteria bacterium]|uniref:Twitching motility protein PilT n=1 Tax=Candidatus Saganbacteria bacterium TaxID=2575572 RepID=A0A833NYT8_UNCSA|nr:MAG: twitching motility protein PilT [Candidatus Saganbacteria bacterium]